jgi:putative transposase
MRRGRFTEDQIIGVLREQEAGVKTADLCRKHGISDATFYNWKAKYGGMTVSEAARLRTLEDENRRLKKRLRPITSSCSPGRWRQPDTSASCGARRRQPSAALLLRRPFSTVSDGFETCHHGRYRCYDTSVRVSLPADDRFAMTRERRT